MTQNNRELIMTQNIERLREVAKPRSEEAKNKARQRREDRDWLRMSQDRYK